MPNIILMYILPNECDICNIVSVFEVLLLSYKNNRR